MRHFGAGVLCLLSIALFGCTAQQETGGNKGMAITASFYPIYDAAKSIAGDKATVSVLVPPGVEPHDYEPTPGQVISLNKAGAFIILGTGFETLENKLAGSIDSRVMLINAGEGIPLELATENEEGEKLSSPVLDPHLWLSPKRMIMIANNIKKGFQAADPANGDYYEKNFADYSSELQRLDGEFAAGLSNCRQDTVLVNHRAFGYLASDYNFRQVAISGLSPDSEPTPQSLARLADIARGHNIKYVLYESLADPKIAQTVAAESGARVLELNPAEGSTDHGDNYIKIMRRNLITLKQALECN